MSPKQKKKAVGFWNKACVLFKFSFSFLTFDGVFFILVFYWGGGVDSIQLFLLVKTITKVFFLVW